MHDLIKIQVSLLRVLLQLASARIEGVHTVGQLVDESFQLVDRVDHMHSVGERVKVDVKATGQLLGHVFAVLGEGRGNCGKVKFDDQLCL